MDKMSSRESELGHFDGDLVYCATCGWVGEAASKKDSEYLLEFHHRQMHGSHPLAPVGETAGPLTSVVEWKHDGHAGWTCAFVLDFDGQHLCIEVDPDGTGMVDVTGDGPRHEVGSCQVIDVSGQHPWAACIGEDFTTMWRLDDTRGELDGWQIEFTQPDGPAEVVQLRRVQGGLHVTVMPGP